MRIAVDKTQWPLVQVSLPDAVNDEDVMEYLDQLRELRERRSPYSIVVDLRNAATFTPRQRKMQADYMKGGFELAQRYLLGLSFVLDSRLKRGVLQAIFWLQPPPAPYRLFAALPEAIEWARSLLAKAGRAEEA